MPPKVVAGSVQEGGGGGKHKCVMCELVLPSKSELQDHFRLHANGTIDMKGRVRQDPNKKVAEVKVVAQSGCKQWISCDVCMERLETVTLAIQHKFKKHPNSNVKYFCQWCGKQFPLEICKTNHITADHSGEKRSNKLYRCKDCSAEFFTVEAIKFHIRSTHQRVTALINPVATLGPSKKIKMNISGESSSVYYCHLCGQEYMVKFNLQKHLETNHSSLERKKPPEQLIKCKLCEAIFYNQRAWQSHNLLHSPKDLYLHSEADRKLAVTRVDQDFDQSRVPSLLEKLMPLGRPKKMTPDREAPVNSRDNGAATTSISITSSTSITSTTTTRSTPPLSIADSGPGGRNRAVVDSDSENNRSDTSIESEGEGHGAETQHRSHKKKLPLRKKRKIKK